MAMARGHADAIVYSGGAFMLTIAPVRRLNTTGSPINPIALL
jgi:hypothetical protein